MNHENLMAVTLSTLDSAYDYVGVDAADLRSLFKANRIHPQGAAWLAANGSKVGMLWIACATLRELLDLPPEKPTGNTY